MWYIAYLITFVYSGVDDNETIKIYRSGGADPESNQPGDLYVAIKVGDLFIMLYITELKGEHANPLKSCFRFGRILFSAGTKPIFMLILF